MGFGIDSFIECALALIMIWRLRAEKVHKLSGDMLNAIELKARKLVGASLGLLAMYVAMDAVMMLWHGEHPEFSLVGILLTSVSLGMMQWLAPAKRRLAHGLDSRAMEADAFQTTACWWLSLVALVGVGLNGAFGWWWADPVAALVISVIILREGYEAWGGERDCC